MLLASEGHTHAYISGSFLPVRRGYDSPSKASVESKGGQVWRAWVGFEGTKPVTDPLDSLRFCSVGDGFVGDGFVGDGSTVDAF